MKTTPQSLAIALVTLVGAPLFGCSSEAKSSETNQGGGAAGSASGGTGGGGAGGAGGADDPEPTYCEALGLGEWAFDATAELVSTINALAADFTIETVGGAFTLSEAWTGCDNYVFVPQTPAMVEDHGIDIWASADDMDAVFAALPRNTHLFFMPDVADDESTSLARQRFDEALSRMAAEDAEWWGSHVHVAKVARSEAPEPIRASRLGTIITRRQRIRHMGVLSDFRRGYNESAGWFDPNLAMLVHDPIYRNFVAEREERLAAEASEVTIVHAWQGEQIGSDGDWDKSGDMTTWASIEVDLPTASEIAGFDTLELDFAQGCGGVGEVGYCPAWDRIARVRLCDDPDDKTSCNTEIGRWITTYHREGRWVHDVSALLPLLGDGGKRTLLYESHDSHYVTLDFRFSNRGKDQRSTEVYPLYEGGALGETYGDNRQLELDIPADAKTVELAYVLSGHGMEGFFNCAEFCNIHHHFVINGTDNVVETPNVSVNNGCEQWAGRGTVPNQPGTWWYGRAGWCPGLEVPIERLDITDQLTLGARNSFDYHAGLPSGASTAGSIDLRSYIIVYR